MAHSAPLFDDAHGYRVDDPLDLRLERDCIQKLHNHLILEGFSEQAVSSIVDETRALVIREIEYATAAEHPDPKELYVNLYE